MAANPKWLRILMDKVQADILREDGRLERLDELGCGHPVGHVRGFLYEVETIHGCTGLCKDWPTQEVRKDKE